MRPWHGNSRKCCDSCLTKEDAYVAKPSKYGCHDRRLVGASRTFLTRDAGDRVCPHPDLTSPLCG